MELGHVNSAAAAAAKQAIGDDKNWLQLLADSNHYQLHASIDGETLSSRKFLAEITWSWLSRRGCRYFSRYFVLYSPPRMQSSLESDVSFGITASISVCSDVELTVDECDAGPSGQKPDAEPTRSTIRKWPEELKNQRKVELHCKRMARFRNRRAADKKSMLEERRLLELELHRRIEELRHDGVHGSLSPVRRDMQRLVLEREALRDESVALKQEIARRIKFQRVIHSTRDKVAPEEGSHADSVNTTVRFVDSSWKPVQEQGGWRVHFTTGDPSFVFHPFSRSELDAIFRRHDAKASAKSTDLKMTGNFLGWSVYHGATLPGNRWLVGHARYSKRVDSSMDSILDNMCNDDGSSKWPIMPTSGDLGFFAEISVQTVQELDESSSVIVRSYSGDVNYRYMCVVQRSKPQMFEGKRAVKFYYLVGDSEANARSRDAEPTGGNDVCWIVEEVGYSLTLIEVNESTVDVVLDSFGCFNTSEQVLEHFTKFGRLVMRWQQIALSPNLLKLS